MGYGSDFVRNPKRDKRGLTKAQAIFADNVPLVGRPEAAAMAYPDATPESQKSLACENMAKPEVVLSIGKIADRIGLTRQSCAETIRKGLDARDGKTALRAAELGLKLHGELRDNTVAIPIPVTKEQYADLCRAFWTSKP